MKKMFVLLGRFCPFHNGHRESVEKMIGDGGIENCMIMIGSSSSYNERTPFTYEQRKEIIQTIYPEVLILPLPDVSPEKKFFDGSTNDEWLKRIKKIEEGMGVKFVFYGGSNEDLSVLSQRFETVVAVNRHNLKNSVSATEVRMALDSGNEEFLRKSLDPRVIGLVKKYYREYLDGKLN